VASGLLFMLLPLTVSAKALGFRLRHCPFCPFVWSDIVITISHKRREQFW